MKITRKSKRLKREAEKILELDIKPGAFLVGFLNILL